MCNKLVDIDNLKVLVFNKLKISIKFMTKICNYQRKRFDDFKTFPICLCKINGLSF